MEWLSYDNCHLWMAMCSEEKMPTEIEVNTAQYKYSNQMISHPLRLCCSLRDLTSLWCNKLELLSNISPWQGNDRSVYDYAEWAICGSWCRAPYCGQCDSTQVCFSVWVCKAGADSVVGWCDTLRGYCYRWPTLMCLTLWLPPPLSLSLHLRETPLWRQADLAEGRGINTPRTNTQPVGLSLGEHTMTKKGPAVIASPCLMWSDDGSSLARRWEPDELSGAKQLQMRNRQTRAAYREHNRHVGMPGHVLAGGNGVTCLCLPCTYNTNNIASGIHYTSTQQVSAFPLQCLVNYKTAEIDYMHCFMLHSHHQRNVLCFLAVKEISSHSLCLGSVWLWSQCVFLIKFQKRRLHWCRPWPDSTGRHMLSLSSANRSAVL